MSTHVISISALSSKKFSGQHSTAQRVNLESLEVEEISGTDVSVSHMCVTSRCAFQYVSLHPNMLVINIYHVSCMVGLPLDSDRFGHRKTCVSSMSSIGSALDPHVLTSQCPRRVLAFRALTRSDAEWNRMNLIERVRFLDQLMHFNFGAPIVCAL